MRIGVDLGGTKIEAIALDARRRASCARQRSPTPRDDYDATLAGDRHLVAALERDAARRGTVGVGMPGAISPATGLVKNANSTWLNGRAFDRDLETALRPRGAAARTTPTASRSPRPRTAPAAGARVVFGVILGTGHRRRRSSWTGAC